MFSLILDGLLVFDLYKWNIAAFLLTVVGFGMWTVDQLGEDKEDPWVKLAFAFATGIVVFAPFAFLLVVLSYTWPAIHEFASLLLLGLAFVLLIRGIWPQRYELNRRSAMPIVLFLFLYLVLRLAYLSRLILPPYSDSVIHYQIISGFLDPALSEGFNLSLKNIFVNYYHFGFHSIAAWLISVTNMSIADAISLFGPLFLIISPISTSLLAYTLTRNKEVAFFSGLLAAVGWSMPAFSVNWGKFPALGAITAAPGVMAVILYSWQNPIKKPVKILIMILLAGGVALLHSRALMFLAVGGIVVWAAGKFKIEKELSFFQAFRFTLLFIISLSPVFEYLSGFYKGIWLFIPILIFAFRAYPRVSIGVFLFTFGLWLLMKSSHLAFGVGKSILDRQFFEMSVYLPLSLICAAGVQGMIRHISILKGDKISRLVSMILVAGLAWNFLIHGAFYPDHCCNYYTKDDQNVMQWIQNNTPMNSLFLISTFQNEDRAAGTDGGMWLEAITERSANKIPFNIIWESATGIKAVCSSDSGKVYIYSGGREFSFADKPLRNSRKFQPVFQSGKAVVYQVISCQH